MKKTTPIVAIASGALIFLTFSFIAVDFNPANWSELSRFMCAVTSWVVVPLFASFNEAQR